MPNNYVNNMIISDINGELSIDIPRYFRDISWAENIGQIQNSFDLIITEKKLFNKFTINFQTCRWADPLPLMSILVELFRIYNSVLKIEIKLPIPTYYHKKIEKGPYQRSPNKFLLFLYQSGFFYALEKLDSNRKVVILSGNIHSKWQKYSSLQTTPSYENSNCIPITILSMPSKTENELYANEIVDNLLNKIDKNIINSVHPVYIDSLIYKLRICLQELIQNAQEHAYYDQNSEPNIFSIYVRYRVGGFGRDTASRELFDDCVRKENTSCPELNSAWLSARKGCLEIFALDRGKGLVKSFLDAGYQFNYKYKLLEILKKTFCEGISTKSERETKFGGLHLLHNLLSDSGDYIRAIDDGIWYGSGVPLIRITEGTHNLTQCQIKSKGLAFHLRLSWKEGTDSGPKWANLSNNTIEDYWAELSYSEKDCESSFAFFQNQLLLDERFGLLNVSGNDTSFILWLVKPHRMKGDILNFLEREIAPKVNENSTLIIADIPNYEAETYAAAIGSYKNHKTVNWPSKFKYIIFVTTSLSFAITSYQIFNEKLHGFADLKNDFSNIKIYFPVNPSPRSIRLAIFRWIKWHDSKVFWSEVCENSNLYINENILWDKTDTKSFYIAGYLDFYKTTHNKLCLDLYKYSLTRLNGILAGNYAKFYPLDRLVKNIITELQVKDKRLPVERFDSVGINIGSILVSGTTLQSFLSQDKDIHFFIHKSKTSKDKKAALLYWIPIHPVIDSPSNLVRVGKTATIAPDGWKSFEVPRYNESGICIGARSPSETYADLQRLDPLVLKAGHWSYEGHHDFLTLNIHQAISDSFLKKDSLAIFLIERIFGFIGVKKEHFLDKRLFSDNRNTIFEKAFDEVDYGLVVYRSHPITDAIFRHLMDFLNEEGKKLVTSRIFPILPVRMRWKGSTFLAPPLIVNKIKNINKQNKNKLPLLVFDDAAITGRTINDITAILKSTGTSKIYVVVIVNRLRQPSDGTGKGWVNYYWRLDLPVIGNDRNCPICQSLFFLKNFSNSVKKTNAYNLIQTWIDNWENVSPYDDWSSGIYPILLPNQKEKKFCYKQINGDADYLSKINISRSTGLLLHITELHAMTGRDDYCLKKISEYSTPEIKIEIAAGQILLFGQEFDHALKIELFKIILKNIFLLPDNSTHFTLAIISIIYVISHMPKRNKEKSIEILSSLEFNIDKNYLEKCILFAIFISEDLLDIKSSEYEYGRNILDRSNKSTLERFNDIYNEIVSKQFSHSEILPIIYFKVQKRKPIAGTDITDCIDSLEYIRSFFRELEKHLIRKDCLCKYSDPKNDVDLLSQKLIEEFRNFDHSEKAYLILEDHLSNYYLVLRELLSGLFHIIPNVHKYYKHRSFETDFKNVILDNIYWERVIEDKNRTSNFNIINPNEVVRISRSSSDMEFDSMSGEVWIFWNRRIIGILKDLVKNAIYSDKKITNPWDSKSGHLAYMWINFNFQKSFLEISLVNSCNVSNFEIFNMLKSKSYRWESLELVGGSVSANHDINKNLFCLAIRVPYAC